MGKAQDEWSYGDVDAGLKNAALVLDETFVTPDTSHRDAGAAHHFGLLAERQGVRSHGDAEHGADPGRPGPLVEYGSQPDRAHQRIHRRRFRQQSHRLHLRHHSGTAVEEGQCPGDDAHQPRRRTFYRTGAARLPGPDESRFFQGRQDHRAGHVRHLQQRPLRRRGRRQRFGNDRFAVISTAGDALARRDRADQHSAARCRRVHPAACRESSSWSRFWPKRRVKLSLDQVEIRQSQLRRKARRPSGRRGTASADTRPAHFSRKRSIAARNSSNGRSGSRVPSEAAPKCAGWASLRACFFAGSTGYDGLFVIRPDGRIAIQSGIGNLGTESISDVHRVVAEVLGVPWEKCDVDLGQYLARTCPGPASPEEARPLTP